MTPTEKSKDIKVKEALKRMANGKEVGSHNIPLK